MGLLHLDLLTRILVGTLLGGVIGYERDMHGRPAGLRTHMIVALASATFMVISTNFVYFQHYGREDLVAVDTSRIAASVVTGIGFLAGGAILRNGLSVQGLTTAAGLWLVAAIGMAAGSGMYAVGAFVTIVGVTALTVLRRFEDKDNLLVHRKISIVFDEQGSATAVTQRLHGIGVEVTAIDYDKRFDEKVSRVKMAVRFPQSVTPEMIMRELESEPGIRRLRSEPAS